MPFLLWVIYPYSMWMGCVSLMLEHEKSRP